MTSLIQLAVNQNSSITQPKVAAAPSPKEKIVMPTNSKEKKQILNKGTLTISSLGIILGSTFLGRKQGEKNFALQNEELKKIEKKNIETSKSLAKEFESLNSKEFSDNVMTLFDELDSAYVYKTELHFQGQEISYNNSIMLVCDNKESCEELVNWAKKCSYTNFETLRISASDDISEQMKNLATTLNKIKNSQSCSPKHTLFYIENFENLINPSTNS